MQNSNSQWPINWEDYEQGRSPRQGSIGSTGSRIQFDDAASTAHPRRPNAPRADDPHVRAVGSGDQLRRRRSSLSMRLASVAHAGGPNSLENFARSWSRAANFIEIPARPTYIVADEADEPVGHRRSGEPVSPAETRGLLRQQLERQDTQSSSEPGAENLPLLQGQDEPLAVREAAHGVSPRPSGIFDRSSMFNSPFASSFGGVYGSFPPRYHESVTARGTKVQHDPQTQVIQTQDDDQEIYLVKVVEQEDGTKIQVVVGQSTLPQTVFNSINVLIGVGLLSLPLGLKQSGWLIGMSFLVFAAITTRYTAGVLAKCLDIDHSLVTFSDLAWKAFGSKARIAVGLLFTLELIAACVALVILFADSLYALFPVFGVTQWKIICGIIMIPLSFVPLRFLSFTSVLGIVSCLGIVTLIFVDGFIKPDFPGSLRSPAIAPVFPVRWSELPLSLGLLMSPWGGHSVFPNIYRDMRHPQKYSRAVNYTFTFTSLLDFAVSVAGYLMFGQHVYDEVTSNIFRTKGYPRAITVCIIVFISIIPITKIPLNARPINIVVEAIFGLTGPRPAHSSSSPSSSALLDEPRKWRDSTRSVLKALIRVAVLAVITVLAILVPGFDTVMALMGSAMAFSICIVLPLAFNLKLFRHQLSRIEQILNSILIVVCSVMAVVGTVWVFLPRKLRESLDGF